MSLLNDMLKDLNRNKQSAKSGPLLATNQKITLSQAMPDISLRIVMPFICSATFLLIIFSYNAYKTHHKKISTAHMAQQVPVTTPQITTALTTIPSVPTLPITTANIIPETPKPILISKLPPIIIPEVAAEPEQPSMMASTDEAPINKVFTALTDTEWHDEQLNLALTAIQEGNDDSAEQRLSNILTRFPKAIVARETLANLYLAQARLDTATQVVDEGLRFLPNAIGLNTIKARLALEQKHPQEALGILKQLNPDIHKHAEFYGLMAAILQSLGKNQEAGNLYKVLVEIEPSNGQYWLGYGLSLEHNKANKQAISAYREVTAHYDVDPEVRAYAENRLKTLQG